MDDTKITVLIPTYNRKSKLQRTLLALEKQSNQRFNIIISDNASDYSIEEEIFPQLAPQFIDKILIHHRPYNIGGQNIIGVLGMCPTEYGWLLGDDDYVQDDAINIIYREIDRHNDANILWFSVDETFFEKSEFCNMNTLTTFLEARKAPGDFIFCSNKVYKMSVIRKYLEPAHTYQYTKLSQCIPILECLKAGKKVVVIGGARIVKHSGFEVGSEIWDVSKVALGMRTLMDYNTGVEWNEHCRFVKAVMLPPEFVLKMYIKLDKLPWNYPYYLKTLYSDTYKYCYSPIKRIMIFIGFSIAERKGAGALVIMRILTIKNSLKSKIKEKLRQQQSLERRA